VPFLRALARPPLRPAALRALVLRALVAAPLRPAALRDAVVLLRPVVFFAAKVNTSCRKTVTRLGYSGATMNLALQKRAHKRAFQNVVSTI
jgi:hypothetical protein